MTEILAEAGRITGLGPETGGKIIFGLQSAYAKQAGQEPMRCEHSGPWLDGGVVLTSGVVAIRVPGFCRPAARVALLTEGRL